MAPLLTPLNSVIGLGTILLVLPAMDGLLLAGKLNLLT